MRSDVRTCAGEAGGGCSVTALPFQRRVSGRQAQRAGSLDTPERILAARSGGSEVPERVYTFPHPSVQAGRSGTVTLRRDAPG